MIKIEEFQRVCRLSGLVEVSNSKTCAFKTFDQKEGLEVIAGKIQTFQIIEMKDKTKEKVISDKVQNKDILAVVGAFEFDTKEPVNMNNVAVISDNEYSYNDQKIKRGINELKTIDANIIEKGTEKGTQDSNILNAVPGLIGSMPDYITKILFEKWQAMPVEQRLIMLQTTDSRNIEERRGRGGKMYPYVKGSYMVQCANMAFGFAWTTRVERWERTDTEIICMGYVEAEICNKPIRKYAVGQQDIAFVKDTKTVVCLGDNYKAAETDMIKKALSFFGIAKDVYSGEV